MGQDNERTAPGRGRGLGGLGRAWLAGLGLLAALAAEAALRTQPAPTADGQAHGLSVAAAPRGHAARLLVLAPGLANQPRLGDMPDAGVRLAGGCGWPLNRSWPFLGAQLFVPSLAQAPPPWWTPQRIGRALMGAGVGVLGVLVWLVALHARVRKQTEVIRRNLEREAALEKRYQDWFENANDIIYTFDLDGNFTSVNRAGLRVSGYAADEVRSLNIARVVAPDYLPMVREEIARKLRGEPARPYEIHILTKTGQRVELEVHTRLIVQDGKPVGIQGIARDISERKRAEKRSTVFSRLGHQLSVATSAEQAARVALNAADELLGWDACSLALVAADRTHDTEVLTIDTIGGKRVEAPVHNDRVSPMTLRVLREASQLILREGDSPRADELVRFGDVARRSASLMFVPIRHGNEAIGVLTIQSYTPRAYNQESLHALEALADDCGGAMHRLQVEAARRDSEARKTAILESALDCVITVEQSGKIMECNSATEKTFGCARAELIGKPLEEWLIAPAFTQSFREGLAHCLATGEPGWAGQRAEMRAARADRTEFPVELAISRIPGDGPPACTVVVRDITERLNLEAQLRHAQKLESVGQLAAGVAHDFNNILGVIQGYASLLLTHAKLEAGTQEPLAEICAAAERAANLTRQLLAFSRKQLMRPKALDLGAVVGNVIRLLHRIIGEDIAVQFNCAGALPPIYADVGMVEQVLMNLAVNARDAMPRGGQLTISAAPADISEDHARLNPEARPGQFVCLSVADDGCGMDQQTLGRLFEPFFTTKDVGKGTGLGLATVYGIMKQHDGWIEVASEVGRGTTFKVFFPVCAKPEEVAESRPATTPIEGGEETILLVEDERALQALAGRILRRYGYEVLTAANGAEALGVWRQHGGRVKLLVTDMVMPAGMSGLDLAGRLRAMEPQLKVLYTSGYTRELAGQGADLPADCKFLAKPYPPSALAAAVRECLDA